jgi:hypothetical protein
LFLRLLVTAVFCGNHGLSCAVLLPFFFLKMNFFSDQLSIFSP